MALACTQNHVAGNLMLTDVAVFVQRSQIKWNANLHIYSMCPYYKNQFTMQKNKVLKAFLLSSKTSINFKFLSILYTFPVFNDIPIVQIC